MPSFAKFYQVLPSFTKCCQVLPSFTKFCQVCPSFANITNLRHFIINQSSKQQFRRWRLRRRRSFNIEYQSMILQTNSDIIEYQSMILQTNSDIVSFNIEYQSMILQTKSDIISSALDSLCGMMTGAAQKCYLLLLLLLSHLQISEPNLNTSDKWYFYIGVVKRNMFYLRLLLNFLPVGSARFLWLKGGWAISLSQWMRLYNPKHNSLTRECSKWKKCFCLLVHVISVWIPPGVGQKHFPGSISFFSAKHRG